jgi:hypothetical protein
MTFAFDRFHVRPTEERDRAYLEALIAKDRYHAGMDPNYFLHLLPGEDAWAIENERGRVVLYFRTSVAARLAMLFGDEGRLENYRALTEGMTWIEGVLARNRFRQIIFDTEGQELRSMALRRLGFLELPNALGRSIHPTAIDESMAALWNRLPQASRDGG